MNLKNLAMWGVIVFLTIGLYNMFKNPQASMNNKDTIISELVDTESLALMNDDVNLIDEMLLSNSSIDMIAESLSKKLISSDIDRSFSQGAIYQFTENTREKRLKIYHVKSVDSMI